ncbi:hypothetical protein NQ314_000477 [Rhamnusium bicolor]|uniref:Cytochrome P450 n=1 Tax=Rhamnusium bicolor TaxID=1586634 RepID=A0AAV8ZU16_9CUCU|nr:hypothetical protein NQ314_000477 [Rhamnusium bicolor]
MPYDTLVIGNLHSGLMGQESGYDEPEAFKPERYLKNSRISVNENFLPFGFGKHRCLGETLARANLFLFISTLLQKFTFTIVPEHPPTGEWRDGVTPGPRPFKARVIPRK